MAIGQIIRSALRHRAEQRAAWTVSGHPKDPAIAKMIGVGRESDSGVPVDRNSALKYPPLWRGVNLISSDVAKLPINVFRRVEKFGSPGKEKATEHKAFNLLRHAPFPSQWLTPFGFKRLLQSHALMEGNGYAYIFRDPNGVPTELVPLLPDRTYPIRVNGELWYVTRARSASGQTEERKLDPGNVIHIRGLGFDGLCGYSVYDVGLEALGLGLGAQKFAAKFFGNGSHTTGVFLVPKHIALDEQQLNHVRESFASMHRGLDNAWKFAVYEEGIQFQKTGVDPEQAQMLQSRQFDIKMVADLLGIPPHKLGDDGKTSYSSLEQENQSYLDECLDSWLVNWEEELYQKLLTEDEKASDSHLIEFNRDALLRADVKTRYETYAVGIDRRILNPNECRAKENMDPYEGGSDFTPPGFAKGAEAPRVVTGPDLEAGKQAADTDDDDLRSRLLGAHRALIVDAANRAYKRLGVHARRAAADPRKFTDWLDTFPAEHETVVRDMFAPAVLAVAALSGADTVEQCATLVGKVLGEYRVTMDALAARCTSETLAGAVNSTAERCEATGGESIADVVVKVENRYALA